MHFDSTHCLPEDMTNHARISWGLYEAKLSEALRATSLKPADSVYVQGDHAIIARDGEEIHTNEAMTYCSDCGAHLRTEIIAARQAAVRVDTRIAPKLAEDPGEMARILTTEPGKLDWWDMEDLFADTEEADTPRLGEGGCPNHDSACSRCGATLAHALDDCGFGDEIVYWRETALAQVTPDVIYGVLLMMEHAPGDAEVLSIAARTASLLDRDGIVIPQTETEDATH